MQHAPQTHPGEMDEPGDQRVVDDQPAPRSIDVRGAPGVAQPVDLRWLESRLRAAVEHLAQGEGAEIARLDVLIVDDARMKRGIL